MPLFENLKDVKFGSTTLEGCQSATLECGADEIEHSECDDVAIAYRGVTGLTDRGSIELAGVSLAREIGSVDYAGVLSDALSGEFVETGEPDVHNADGHCYSTLIRIRKRSVEASVTYRGLRAAGTTPGFVDTLKLGYLLGSLDDGCPVAGSAVLIEVESMMVVGCTPVNAQHNEFAEATLNLKATASIKDVLGGPALTAIHVGDVGTVSWSVPSADGGSDFTVSVTLAVITEKRIRFEHGGMLRESFSFQAYSADGSTPPGVIG